MKKFNLKKSAKYIICTLLTLTVVATAVSYTHLTLPTKLEV